MNAMNANLQQPPVIVKLLRSFIMRDKAQIQLHTHTHTYIYIRFNLGIMIWVASFDYLLPTADRISRAPPLYPCLSCSPACPANNMLTPIPCRLSLLHWDLSLFLSLSVPSCNFLARHQRHLHLRLHLCLQLGLADRHLTLDSKLNDENFLNDNDDDDDDDVVQPVEETR